jgi:hypothetical protein
VDKLEKLFNNYKDKSEDVIGPDNIWKFCDDIGISPIEIEMLLIAFYLKPK